jgi:DNA-binding NtrC family response regulator
METEKTILIITNDTLLSHRLAVVFHANWYNIGIAADSEAAIEAITEREVDLVLVDTFLTDIVGNKLIKKIKNISPGIEIIFTSAIPGTNAEALINGATATIQKPIDFDEILSLVLRCLEARSLRSEILSPTLELSFIKDNTFECPQNYKIHLN